MAGPQAGSEPGLTPPLSAALPPKLSFFLAVTKDVAVRTSRTDSSEAPGVPGSTREDSQAACLQGPAPPPPLPPPSAPCCSEWLLGLAACQPGGWVSWGPV